ncbi:hypothetical protein RFI_01512 [Reticulomyxa filosa]|uniref:RRM domain-containing protein n=1 Tax=Reticulomyxa filosa TaxID=46433 RepID=X6PBX4_RETFI|nr:hypothetical protein RFI_01512 [Reticulomyxa filosa]|eukprot:ETO35559.1 hypothetical protein RFI_01512 [Reticulomyxa filosa]
MPKQVWTKRLQISRKALLKKPETCVVIRNPQKKKVVKSLLQKQQITQASKPKPIEIQIKPVRSNKKKKKPKKAEPASANASRDSRKTKEEQKTTPQQKTKKKGKNVKSKDGNDNSKKKSTTKSKEQARTSTEISQNKPTKNRTKTVKKDESENKSLILYNIPDYFDLYTIEELFKSACDNVQVCVPYEEILNNYKLHGELLVDEITVNSSKNDDNDDENKKTKRNKNNEKEAKEKKTKNESVQSGDDLVTMLGNRNWTKFSKFAFVTFPTSQLCLKAYQKFKNGKLHHQLQAKHQDMDVLKISGINYDVGMHFFVYYIALYFLLSFIINCNGSDCNRSLVRDFLQHNIPRVGSQPVHALKVIKSDRFGFSYVVKMEFPAHATLAVEFLSGKIWKGKPVFINWMPLPSAKPTQEIKPSENIHNRSNKKKQTQPTEDVCMRDAFEKLLAG